MGNGDNVGVDERVKTKHVIETSNNIDNLSRWNTTARKYKEMDVILFAKMNESMRSGRYATYIVTAKHKRYIELRRVK